MAVRQNVSCSSETLKKNVNKSVKDEENAATRIIAPSHDAGGAIWSATVGVILQVETGTGGVRPLRVTSPGRRGCSGTVSGILAGETTSI